MRLSFCSLSDSFPASVGLNDDAIFYSLSLSFPVWLDCEAFFSLTFSFLPSRILLPHTSKNYFGEREHATARLIKIASSFCRNELKRAVLRYCLLKLVSLR